MAAYELIQTQTVASSGSITSLDFTAIPQTYLNLVVKINTRSSAAGTYSNVFWTANGAAQGAGAGRGGTYYGEVVSGLQPRYTLVSSGAWICDLNGSGNYAGTFGNAEVTIPGYSKVTSAVKGYATMSINPDTGLVNQYPEISGGYLSVSAAITRLTFTAGSGTWDAGSYISLYGLKGI
jgi:hypothetical protein